MGGARGNARRSLHSHLLVERLADGGLLQDRFDAAGDAEALRRVAEVVDGLEAELWCEAVLVWRGIGAASAVAEAIVSLPLDTTNGSRARMAAAQRDLGLRREP